MTPEEVPEFAQKVLAREFAAADLDEVECALVIEFAGQLTHLAMELMCDSVEDTDKFKALRAMIVATKVMLAGLDQQRMEFAGGD